MEAVYSEAGANTDAEENIINSYLEVFLQIVEDYYVEKIEDKTWFLAGKTVEEAAALVEEYIKKAENKIVDAVQYHGSFAEYIDGIKQAPDNTNAFHYRNELLRFHGREAELKILREFIESDEELSWIAITGPGGTGKSKLLYYFVKEMGINPKWKSVWIHAENCEQFIKFTEWRYPYNLLVVIDYAGTVASDMGMLMCHKVTQKATLLFTVSQNLSSGKLKKLFFYLKANQRFSGRYDLSGCLMSYFL